MKYGEVRLGNSLVRGLYDQGFLIRSDKNEIDDIEAWSHDFLNSEELIHLTMLPAEACNFACPYCFVWHQRDEIMGDWVYKAVLKFLEQKAINSEKPLSVRISWFGGEPTLAHKGILHFMNKSIILISKYDMKIDSAIVTNGYLLDKDMFMDFIESGINMFQITLDGWRDTHDLYRVTTKGQPTFDKIYNNLRDIMKIDKNIHFELSVRANFLHNNLSSMQLLLEKFKEDFGDDERIHIYFRPVYNFETCRSDIDEMAKDICNMEQGLKIQNDLSLEVMESLGRTPYGRLADPLPGPTYAWCPAVRKNSFIIGADGSVLVCDTYIGDTQYKIGDITPDGCIVLTNEKAWKASVFDSNDKTCINCRLLPICMGGCQRVRLANAERPCFWTESLILDAMQCYADLYVSTPFWGLA